MSARDRPAATSRREFLIGGVLAGTAVATPLLAAAVDRPPALVGKLDALVPRDLAGWMASDASPITIPQGEGAGDPVYDQLLSRHYDNGHDLPVMLLIAFGSSQSGSTQLHRPETCYPAAGFRIVDRARLTLRIPQAPAISARVLTGFAPRRTEQILYWSRIGADFPDSGLGQRWSVLRQTFAGGTPDGALVRISTIAVDARQGMEAMIRFASALVGGSTGELRTLLVGLH